MAGRYIKQGLLFFFKDVNFYEDIRIRKIIKYMGGQAAMIYDILLCRIYGNGYYLPWDDDIPFLVMEVSGFKEDYVKEVINYCIEVGLFDKDLFNKEKVLSSKGIQKRYFTAGKDAKRKVASSLSYLLIDIKKDVYQNAKIREQTLYCSDENDKSTEQMPINSEQIGKSSEEMPTREYKIREEKNIPPTNTGAHACVRLEPAPYVEQSSLPGVPEEEMRRRLNKAVEELRQSTFWRESVCMKFRNSGLEDKHIDSFLNQFLEDCHVNGWVTDGTGSNLKSLFISWLEKRRDKKFKFNNKKQDRYGTYKQETVEQLIQRELVGAAETLKKLDAERRANLCDGVSDEIWNL